MVYNPFKKDNVNLRALRVAKFVVSPYISNRCMLFNALLKCEALGNSGHLSTFKRLRQQKDIEWKAAMRRFRVTLDKMTGKRYVHFLHIGKTGGTAIKTALKGDLNTRSQKIFLHSHGYSLSDVPKGEKVFFFLRDPISRFVSGFYSRQRKGRPRYFFPWNEEEEKAFNQFQTPNKLAIAITDDDLEKREDAHHAMQSIRHVRDFYSRWYKDKNYFISRLPDILLVGRQETLAQDFFRLKSLLNLPGSIMLPGSDQGTHRNPPYLDKHLEKAAIRNLSEWYASDYAFLELCAEQADHIEYSE